MGCFVVLATGTYLGTPLIAYDQAFKPGIKRKENLVKPRSVRTVSTGPIVRRSLTADTTKTREKPFSKGD